MADFMFYQQKRWWELYIGHYKSIKSQRSADKEVILNLYSISIMW